MKSNLLSAVAVVFICIVGIIAIDDCITGEATLKAWVMGAL